MLFFEYCLILEPSLCCKNFKIENILETAASAHDLIVILLGLVNYLEAVSLLRLKPLINLCPKTEFQIVVSFLPQSREITHHSMSARSAMLYMKVEHWISIHMSFSPWVKLQLQLEEKMNFGLRRFFEINCCWT